MAYEDYADQVQLLVNVLPFVAREEIFALKGGTAINLFYRDLPRLSVDIDLTYLPVKDRAESLTEINDTLDRIAKAIGAGLTDARVTRIAGGGNNPTRIQVQRGGANIKIETSPVTRGVVRNPETRAVTETVEDAFGFAEIQVVSFEDLYGGKLCAAADRQHPRDLYDVRLLYEHEGLTDDLFKTFLVYVASSGRPPHELLNPNPKDLDEAYVKEFEGMTTEPVPLTDLLDTRTRLITDIRDRLDPNAQEFLRGLHYGAPDFTLIDAPHAADLPAVRWKLQNIAMFMTDNPDRHAAQSKALEELFT
ncbi:nucleotidyl transferase AbiEii/AbiGii toxin family protein [Roseovarius pacificus]|uniref:nucleotidyl transferase AbiEii/AbiGii toxin family protein n=1 Tax=Roseovarius pacificus TaxID=337701 RepID=UPI002A18DEB3|nr:nucleotidyl transferase AbiEii/AbiGii toxin family protein [Roseovarius pacificus]